MIECHQDGHPRQHGDGRRTTRLLGLATAALLALAAPRAEADIVAYRNNFESGTAGFTASDPALLTTVSRPTDAAGGSPSQWLGTLANNDSLSLSLGGLTPGEIYTVSFDLLIGGSWDGNSTNVGPDHWSLKAGDVSLVDTSFLNITAADDGALDNNLTQSYSDANPTGGGAFDAYSGADVLHGQDVKNGYFDRYAIYYFSHGAGNPLLQFVATGSTTTLTFAGFGLQDAGDEYWSIDNVSVSAVPEPSALLLTLGLGGCLVVAYRHRRHVHLVNLD